MGMFDYVVIHYPFPEPEMQEAEFQTKSLGCDLYTYVITEAGRLVWRRYLGVLNGVDKYNFPDYCITGYEQADMNYHGDLELHGWHGRRYIARFINGTIDQIERYE